MEGNEMSEPVYVGRKELCRLLREYGIKEWEVRQLINENVIPRAKFRPKAHGLFHWPTAKTILDLSAQPKKPATAT